MSEQQTTTENPVHAYQTYKQRIDEQLRPHRRNPEIAELRRAALAWREADLLGHTDSARRNLAQYERITEKLGFDPLA